MSLLFDVVCLITVFFGLFDEDVTIALIVPNNLIDSVVVLENAFFVRELSNVFGRLRIL